MNVRSCLGKFEHVCGLHLLVYECLRMHACNEGPLLPWPLKWSQHDSLSFFSSHSISARALWVQSSSLSLSHSFLSFFTPSSWSSVFFPFHHPPTFIYIQSVHFSWHSFALSFHFTLRSCVLSRRLNQCWPVCQDMNN